MFNGKTFRDMDNAMRATLVKQCFSKYGEDVLAAWFTPSRTDCYSIYFVTNDFLGDKLVRIDDTANRVFGNEICYDPQDMQKNTVAVALYGYSKDLVNRLGGVARLVKSGDTLLFNNAGL